MQPNNTENDAQELAPEQAASEAIPAWEEIEAGRFMPRRIRGSFRGRTLG